MTPGKNPVKSNGQFRASAPSGAAPCKTIAESRTPMGSPKSTGTNGVRPATSAGGQADLARLPCRPWPGDREGRKGQPQDGGERLYHREWQFDGQDAEPILRKEYGDQADPSEPESEYEEGHHRVVETVS